ncbi:sortase domain-containing protein [Terrabacter carboxydivorans]|uniref:Sortase n=1 Tax=Terrabacter carboxydivorans TaxID=619730 RepID=A0ABN3MFS3_9MICO
MTATMTPKVAPAAVTDVEDGAAAVVPRPAGRRVREPLGPTLAALTACMISVSVVCLWFLAQTLLLGSLTHNRTQTELYDQLRSSLADGTAPTGGVIDPGAPVALLSIPTIHVQEVVVEGTSSVDTLGGPGHRRNTVLPGQPGVSVVMGRATTYGAPFGDVTSLQPGDRLTATTALGVSTFRVERIRRDGDPVPAPLADGAGRLTLVTGEGSGTLSALRPASTVYVDAALTSAALPLPAGRPGTVPTAELEMGTDPSALPLVTLGFAALLGLVVGCFRAAAQWRPVLVWTVAAPVALAVAWWTTDLVMRTLPNLF